MDHTSFSADWISQFSQVAEDYGYGLAQLEMPSFNSVWEFSDGGCNERAVKQVKRNSSSWSSSADLHHLSGTAVISFGSSSAFDHNQLQIPEYDIKPKLEPTVSGDEFGLFVGSGGTGRWRAGAGASETAAAREHVVAERKRREKLTQSFILLSSLLPGLKKLDKASVLGEATRYIKQLQEQVKSLEEQTSKTAAESAVTNSRKPRISSIDQDPNLSSSSSSNENFDGSSTGDPIPEIEARYSEKDVLIKLQCQSKQRVVPKILDEIQKLHLTIVNCNAMPFGKWIVVVTVVAKMNDEFSATTKELVSMIRLNLQTLM